jgi:hypothetical protein
VGRLDGSPGDHLDAPAGPDRDGVGVHRHHIAQGIGDTADAALDALADHSADAGPQAVDRIWVRHGRDFTAFDGILLVYQDPGGLRPGDSAY